MEEHRVRTCPAVHGDEPADTLDHGPLEFAGHENRCIAEEVHSRLGGEFGEDGKRVEPVQVVGDQHVVAASGNAPAALNRNAEERMQHGHRPQAQQAIRQRGLPLHGKKVGGRLSLRYLIGAPCSWRTPRIMPSLASRALRYESPKEASPFFVVSRSRRSSSSSKSVETSSGEWVTSRPVSSGTLTWCSVRWAIM